MNTRAFYQAGGFLGEAVALADARRANGAILKNAATQLGQTGVSQSGAWRSEADALAAQGNVPGGRVGALLGRIQTPFLHQPPYHAVSCGFLLGWAHGATAHKVANLIGEDLAAKVGDAKLHGQALAPTHTSWPAATTGSRFQALINKFGKEAMRSHWASHTRTLMTTFRGSLR